MERSADEYDHDENFIRFEYETGIEINFEGDELRKQLAKEIIRNRETISKRAIGLLESFMRDRGVFELSAIDVFARQTSDGGDFSMQYNFTADREPDAYGYTYFEVIFGCRAPPAVRFWPFKFIVGFY